MTFPIPKHTRETTLEIKKSLFHCRIGFAASKEDAKTFLEQVKSDYPDAGHHCFAYLIGAPENPNAAAMSDDGEPGGTAGKPILNVLQHKNIGNIVAVVARYFGGVKLGSGGLVRAYSGATQQTIEQLQTIVQIPRLYIKVETDFKNEQFFRHFIEKHQGVVDDCVYGSAVTLFTTIPSQHIEDLRSVGANLHANIKVIKS